MTEYVYLYRQEGCQTAVLTNDPKWLKHFHESDKELSGDVSGVCHRFVLDGLECELRMNGFKKEDDFRLKKNLARDVAELFIASSHLNEEYTRYIFSRLS